MQDLPEFAYIYGLYDPRRPEIMMYVGKTNNHWSRLYYHRKNAKSEKSFTPKQWFRDLQSQGIEPQIKVLERCPFSEWRAREIALIAEWRIKNPNLLNKHAGGNGTDVKGKKEFCDKCGAKRYLLTPTDTTLRCPVCRRKQNRNTKQRFDARHPGRMKEYARNYYEQNGEVMRVRARTRAQKRLDAGLCTYARCPNHSTPTNKYYCVEHCAYISKLSRASRIRCGRTKTI